MGIIFAPGHRAVAGELARVCEPGGRLGFSAWRKDAGFTPVTRRFSLPATFSWTRLREQRYE